MKLLLLFSALLTCWHRLRDPHSLLWALQLLLLLLVLLWPLCSRVAD
jgi:hypothetical protein